jgi:hypothetical protein
MAPDLTRRFIKAVCSDEAVEAYRKAILASFSDETIMACEKGIHRCEVKKKYR